MRLYTYYRSSSSYRVRIALGLKKIKYQSVFIHLLKDGGEQHKESFKNKNYLSQVPVLEVDGQFISQSMAILHFLDKKFKDQGVPLFFDEPFLYSKIIEFCEIINSNIQPFQNLSVLQKLKSDWNASEDQVQDWIQAFLLKGLHALEKKANSSSLFSFGETPTAADCYLIPQLYSARRFNINLSSYPKLLKIEKNALALDAFIDAQPENQKDVL